MPQTEQYDVIILGAGAAGLMAALTTGQRGQKVLVVDHADKAGKKILISGGGRCNFTNIHTTPERFLSSNRHFMKSALSRYTPQDFLQMVQAHGIAWHEKTLGQLFCDGSAREILAMLLDECNRGGVKFALGQGITRVSHDGKYTVHFGGRQAQAPALVVATGGPSIPKMGASGFAFDLARQFGLKVVEPRPALVPFTLGPDEIMFRNLSGVATDVIASLGKVSFREAALFTHKGLSGPAILQISSYWRPGQTIHLNFLPDLPPDWLIERKKDAPRKGLKSALAAHLPERLATALAERIGLATALGITPDKRLHDISAHLAKWPFTPTGTEGFAKAEVTVGGVSTDGLSSRTMEAKQQPGLYFIGESVDVTGWLGGYNFQWAWASGFAAAEAITSA